MGFGTVEIRGAKELERMLKILPSKMSRQLQMKALRAGSKPLVKAARINAPKRTRTLSKSVGVVNDKDRRGAALWVAIRTGRKFKNDGWYGWFVERGTKGHGKRTRSKGSVSYAKKGSGLKGTHFFENAWDTVNKVVYINIREELAKVIIAFLRAKAPKFYR